MSYIYNLTDTWNAAGTTFAGIKMAVTNTASSASSNLLDLSVSGATTASFAVNKSGELNLNGTITTGVQQTTSGALILANTAAGAFATTIQSSNSASAAWTLTLPTTAGTANYALTTNGSGVTSWSQISLTAGVTGTLPIGNGGTNNASSYTAGSIIYSNGTSLTQNNAKLFWDNTNVRLGIGTAAPGFDLQVNSSGNTTLAVTTTTSAQFAGAFFAVQNTNSSMANQAGFHFQAGIADGSATKGYFAANQINNTGGFVQNLFQYNMQFDFWLFATAGTERLRITSSGNIHTPAGSTSMTAGFFYMPAAAGVPSGTPTAITGTVPFYYDTTGNQFYVYNGAWKKVALT